MSLEHALRHTHSFCRIHPSQFLHHICTTSSCNNRLLCTDCLPNHTPSHKYSLVPLEEFLNDRILSVMDLKAKSQLEECTRINESNTLLEKIEHSLEATLAVMKNTIFNIHQTVIKYKQQMAEKSKQKYTSEDWLRFKEHFRRKRETFLSSEAGACSAELEAFAVHYGSIISKLDEDNCNTSEVELAFCLPTFEKAAWEGVISRSMREIEDHYNNLLSRMFPSSPKQKVQVTCIDKSVTSRLQHSRIGSLELSSIGVNPKGSMTARAYDQSPGMNHRKSAMESRRDLRSATQPGMETMNTMASSRMIAYQGSFCGYQNQYTIHTDGSQDSGVHSAKPVNKFPETKTSILFKGRGEAPFKLDLSAIRTSTRMSNMVGELSAESNSPFYGHDFLSSREYRK